MYFDAVLDITYKPVFNGSEDETRAYVKDLVSNPRFKDYQVCIGRTLKMVSLKDYLSRT